jgi:hypothetical protein
MPMLRHAPQALFWYGMTEAGAAALQNVMSVRRVAIQFVSLLPYILEGCVIKEDNWQPIVLLPARAANLDTPNWLIRAPQAVIRETTKRKVGHRLLTPCRVGATADQFFGVNTGGQL